MSEITIGEIFGNKRWITSTQNALFRPFRVGRPSNANATLPDRIWSRRVRLAAILFAVEALTSVSFAQGSANSFSNVYARTLQLLEAGDTAGARRESELALSIATKQDGSESAKAAHAMLLLASTYRSGTEKGLSLTIQQRAVSIYERVLSPKDPNMATALNNLAVTYRSLGQHEMALPLYERALSIYEQTLGLEHPRTLNCLNNLAVTFRDLARYEDSVATHNRARGIYERVYGSTDHRAATSMSNLAETYRLLAQFDLALTLNRKALGIREQVLGPNHHETATSLNNIALTYQDLGQYKLALPLQTRALRIFSRTAKVDDLAVATTLSNLAITRSAMGRHELAVPLLRRALAIRERELGTAHPETAVGLNALADTFVALGRYPEALRLHLRAKEIREVSLGPGSLEVAESLGNLAVVQGALGRAYEALPFALRSLLIVHTSLGPDHPKAAATQGLIGVLYRMQNEDDLASVFLKSSVNAYQSTRERISRIGSGELRSYTESVSKTYQLLAEVLTSQGRLSEAQMVLDMLKEDEQFDFIRRSAAVDPRRTRIGYTPTEERWMSRYREIADRLALLGREEQALQKQAKLGLSEEQKKREAAQAADLKVAQAAFESFLEQMRKEFVAKGPARSVEFAESSVQALAELQALLKDLGDDVVLLQIYLTDERVNFLLTTPGVQLARSVKVKTQDLNRQVAALNRQLRDSKSDQLPAAQALFKLLLAPVEQDLQQAGAKTVMLSLDGVLRYLPFGVLHDGQRYALQRWNLPVYTSLVRERLRDTPNAHWQAAGLGVTRRHGEFDPLPAVRAEMRSIIRTGDTGVLPGEVHLDAAFTAQRLKDVSQRGFTVVHVASHFRFSPGTEVNSFLLLGDGNQLTLGDIRTQNYRFDDVDLLTLSACETGLGGGRDQRGREIEGFGVIAQQQGAKAVLATLWNVADQSTATLMGDMYRRRAQGGLFKIEALRQAQLALASNPRTSHPFYWAPFVLMGNWK